jgi:hypothetical protein
MTGNDRERHCARCDKTVYDLSKLTRKQIEAINFVTGGNFCGRITRTSDGRMLIAEDFTVTAEPSRVRSCALPVVGAAFGIVLGLSGMASAQESTTEPISKFPKGSPIRRMLERQRRASIPLPESKESENVTGGSNVTVSGVVRDEERDPIAKVPVTLIFVATGQFQNLVTDDGGAFSISQLSPGEYVLFVGTQDSNRAFQKTLAAGAQWNTEIYLHSADTLFSTGGTACVRTTSYGDTLERADAIALVTIQPFQPAESTDDEELVKQAIPLKLDSTIRGEFPSQEFSIILETNGKNIGFFKPGTRILAFFKRDDEIPGNLKFLEVTVNPDHPETLDHEADWLRQFSRIAISPHSHPADIVEVLVSGVEIRATSHRASQMLQNLYQSSITRRDRELDEDTESTEESTQEEVPTTPISASFRRVIEWGSQRNSLFSKTQKDRLLSVLHHWSNQEPLPDHLFQLAVEFHDPEIGDLLIRRIENVADEPSDMNIEDLKRLEDRAENADLGRLLTIWGRALSSTDNGPSEQVLKSRKLAIFRARRLAATNAWNNRNEATDPAAEDEPSSKD